MQTELLVALVSGAIALGSAALAIYGQFNSTRLANKLENLRLAEQRRLDSEKVVARYREPLARAAYDFQSRLYNILKQDLLGVYFNKGDDRERSYTVDNTTFVVAQYLAWTEIIRREIQYIDLGEDEKTRKLARLQDDVYALFQNDLFGKPLRIFAGEQRAIGERMIINGAKGPECMGYATFLDQLSDSARRRTSPPGPRQSWFPCRLRFAAPRPSESRSIRAWSGRQHLGADPLIEILRTDVRNLSGCLQKAQPRLIALQHALIDLLAFLDPDFIRFPEERRTKVHEAGEAQ